MRLGELLIADGLVLPAHVERVAAVQRERRARIGSLLVDAGLVTADAVARALGRQRTVPAALERHLAGRDPDLAGLIPADLAREHLVLPVARARDGGVVVAMRDPGNAGLRARLAAVIGANVVAAVACELVLRRHVDHAYPPVVEDVDVDLDSGEMPAIDVDEDDAPATELELELDDDDLDLGPPTDILEPQTVRAQPAMKRELDPLDPETIRVGSLVSLDDLGVTRDHRETDARSGPRRSGMVSALPSPTPTPRPPAPSPSPAPAPASVGPGDAMPLTATLTRIATAATRDAIANAIVSHGKATFSAVLILAVRQGMVFGDAGFAPDQSVAAVEAVCLPLNLPSVLKTAVDTARPYAGRPPVGSSVQDRLLKLLGKPAGIVVVPITMSGRVVSLVVGAAASVAAAETAAGELVTIAGASGIAYSRLRS